MDNAFITLQAAGKKVGWGTKAIALAAPKNASISLTAKTAPNDEREIMKAARRFEAIFINMMLKTMRESIQKSELFDKNQGEEMFTSMFDSEVANRMAEQSGLGVARMVFEAVKPAAGKDAANRLAANRAYGAAIGKE
jgi:flagellar protein FlgJ